MFIIIAVIISALWLLYILKEPKLDITDDHIILWYNNISGDRAYIIFK